MESVRLRRFAFRWHPERSADDPVLMRFLAFAREVRGFCPPTTELVSVTPMSWAAVRHIESMIGRASVQCLAEGHSISTARALEVWGARFVHAFVFRRCSCESM
jgi:hypothetical protein